MSERINESLRQIFRTTQNLISSATNGCEAKADDNVNECIAGVPQIHDISQLDSDLISEESDEELDIDKLMAQNSLSEDDDEEEEFVEVKYIDVFKRNQFDGDQPLEEKQIVLREMLLRDNLELLPDLSPADLMTDEELDLLLKRFRPQELLIISRVWPQLKTKICELLVSQPFLWFSTDSTKGRFAAHEDCCDSCDHITDMDESCIEVINRDSLAQVLEAFTFVSHMFSSLKCLRLFRFVINEDSDELIAKMCPNLLHLDLTECKIQNWKQLADQHKRLRHLILSSTQIDEEIFSAIVRKKTSLKTVATNSTNITGESLVLLPIDIERLDTRCCPQLITNYMSEILMTGFTFNHLKYLRLEVVFNDNSFDMMCSAFPNLILLELRASDRRNVRLFTSDGLKHISRLSKLRSLKLGLNIAAHTIPLMDIFIGCPLMTCFSIDGTGCVVVIKQQVLSKMADYWPLLKKLEFKNVDCVEKETIDGLTRLENLSYLDLTNCPFVDDYCFIDNLSKMPRLNYLVLDNCHQLTLLTFDAIIKKALSMDRELTVSLYRANFFAPYMRAKELPKNLRLTFASIKSIRFMTFDGIRLKIFRCQHYYKYFNGK